MDDISMLAQSIGELKGAFGALSISIQSTQEQNREDIGKLFAEMNGVRTELAKLPCITQAGRIDKIEAWQSTHNGKESTQKIERNKADWSLRNSLILAGASLGSSVIGGIVVYWLTCGVK